MRALLLSLLLFADALTNADVVKLVQAGLSPATIEAKIASSATKFDTSTDALVALAKANVPDSVIRSMIERKPVTAPKPAKSIVRRYDVAIHRDEHARCSDGEVRIDGKGIKGSRCKELDFDLAWDDVQSVCYVYGFRGTIVIATEKATHRISTETPAEAKRIVETIHEARPAIALRQGC